MQHHFQNVDGFSVSLDAHDSPPDIVAEFDELALFTNTGDHTNEHPSVLESQAPRQPSPPSSPMSGADVLATGNCPSLRQDPYSLLSALQRDIVLQIQNNDALYPDGVPIRVVFRRTISPHFRVNESEIR